MSASTMFVRSWRVGKYTATLTMPAEAAGVTGLSIEWQPNVPSKLTAAELAAYRRGRNEALQAWAAASGRPVAILDI